MPQPFEIDLNVDVDVQVDLERLRHDERSFRPVHATGVPVATLPSDEPS